MTDDFDKTMVGGGEQAQEQLALPDTLRITLSFSKGPLTDQRVRLTKSVVSVGRKSPADIVIPDPTVSGAHARFEIVNQIVTLIDSQSTNGTFLNGEKIGEATANNMDELGFGDTRALITIVHDPYGLYSDDFGSGETPVKEPEITAVTEPPFAKCLIGGYNPRQNEVLESVVSEKKLARECVTVKNGGEFVQAAAIGFRDKKPIDIVIAEVRMPLLNGVQASIAFRQMEKVFAVKELSPIVLFTEMAQDANIAKAVEFLKPAKYLQSAGDINEFYRRADAIVERLIQVGRKRKTS